MNTRNIFSALAILSVAAIASTGAQATQQSGGMDSYGPGIAYTQKAAPNSVLSFGLIDNENAAGPGIVIQNAKTALAGQTGSVADIEMVSEFPDNIRNGH